jgi:tetratricopeptide (TPR) repeat protein
MNHRIGLAVATAGIIFLIACGSSKEVKRAREFIDARMFDQAIVLLNQEIQQNPKNAEAHMLLGECYLGKGMSGQAEQEFNTATLLDKDLTPELSKSCYDLGKSLAKGDKLNAHRALLMAVKYDPSLEKDEQFYFLTYIDTEDNEVAKTDAAKRYLTLFPTGANRAQATYAVAEGLMSNGARDEAKTYFQQVTTQFPGTEWGKKAGDALANWIETKDVTIAAQQSWVDTGVTVARGQSLTIQANGRWSNGDPPFGPNGGGHTWPGTILASADIGALIGKIGNEVFLVGENYSGSAPASGKLLLSINDVPGTFGDNSGVVNVHVSYSPH